MERTRRSARSTRRNIRGRNTEEKPDIRETIVMQCIVSGIILCSLLILNIVKTDFTNNFRKNLKLALTGQTTITELQEGANNTQNLVDNISNSVKSIFGIKNDETEDVFKSLDEEDLDNTLNKSLPIESDNTLNTTNEVNTKDNRIDEDILDTINSRTDTYGGNLEKKQ